MFLFSPLGLFTSLVISNAHPRLESPVWLTYSSEVSMQMSAHVFQKNTEDSGESRWSLSKTWSKSVSSRWSSSPNTHPHLYIFISSFCCRPSRLNWSSSFSLNFFVASHHSPSWLSDKWCFFLVAFPISDSFLSLFPHSSVPDVGPKIIALWINWLGTAITSSTRSIVQASLVSDVVCFSYLLIIAFSPYMFTSWVGFGRRW